jgi:SAM-dependent methyltransferase
MALDRRRNEAYAAALCQSVRPESVVLDLGAGTGVHGLMAARLGAKRVYLVEPEDILFVAEEVARANSLHDRVHCLRGRIEEVRPPEPVDVIVSVLTGNFLLTEDLLPSLFAARDAVLKPDGVLIPGAATMEAAPVSAAEIHRQEISDWSETHHGVDLGAARVYAANTVHYGAERLRGLPLLAEPRVLCEVDFYRDSYGALHSETTYDVSRSGVCHGWLGWFSIKLGDRWLSTSPYEGHTHWSPVFLPLDPPMTFEVGQQVSFRIDRAPFGDWTWAVCCDGATQQHSTLLGAPMTADTLARASTRYAPELGVHGRPLFHVLSEWDGAKSVECLARSVRQQFPERFVTDAEAVAFVQGLVKRYS